MFEDDPTGQQAFAVGMLAGAGMREMRQALGGNRKKSAAQPGAGMMLQGQMGPVDNMLALARLQGQLPPPGPMSMPGLPPGGPMPMPPGMPPGMLPGGPGPMAAPLGPGGPPLPPGMALPPGAPPMGPPPSTILAPPIPPGGAQLGGLMPMQILQQLLANAQGVV